MAYIRLTDNIFRKFGSIEQKRFPKRKTQYVKLSEVANSLGADSVWLLANFYHLCPSYKRIRHFLFISVVDGSPEPRALCHLGGSVRIPGILDIYDFAVETGDYENAKDALKIDGEIWIRSSLAIRMYPRKVQRLLKREGSENSLSFFLQIYLK